MADDCKPRDRNIPEQDNIPVPPPLCGEIVPASPVPEALFSAPFVEDCCPNDNVERGWYNQRLVLTCSTPEAGPPVVVKYAQFYSTESQEDADQQALDFATQLLSCGWWNEALVIECSECFDGNTVSIPEGTFNSQISQADANAQATAYAESQLSCTPVDRGVFVPDTAPRELIPIVDVHGARGFEYRASAGSDLRVWCNSEPYVDFCDGPTVEGVSNFEILERYEERWKVQLLNGIVTYGLAEGELSPAPASLFPELLLGVSSISISFDANARACFAFPDGGTVRLRRFVSDVPTEYFWVGSSPRLFFDGMLQPISELRDLVCYYIHDGKICARFQRDNFDIEYILVEPTTSSFYLLTTVTRGTTPEDNKYCFLAAVTDDGGLVLLTSAMYPQWPTREPDYAILSAELLSDGDYSIAVLSVDHADYLYSDVIFLADGDYKSDTGGSEEADTLACSASFESDGEYSVVVVTVPTSSEALSAAAALTPDGDYYETVVPAGSYSDTSTATAAFSTDGSYTI